MVLRTGGNRNGGATLRQVRTALLTVFGARR
jgi:hypothetical protein